MHIRRCLAGSSELCTVHLVEYNYRYHLFVKLMIIAANRSSMNEREKSKEDI